MKAMAWLVLAGAALLIPPPEAASASCDGAACARPAAALAVSARKRTARPKTRRAVRHSRAPAYAPAPAQIYPSRPAWASPYECYTDDGYGRFRPCSTGGAPP